MSYLIGPHVHSQYCSLKYLIINATNPLVFIVALPVYELVIYPIIYKYVLPMARRVGIGFLLGMLAVVASLVISLLVRVKQSKLTCVFYESEDEFSIHEWTLLVPLLVSSFAEMLVFIPGKLEK